jgi:transposase
MNIETFVKTLIGYERIDVLDFLLEKDKHHPDQTIFVALVALWEEERFHCPICRKKCDKYDRLNNVKRWRSLDLGKNKFYIESGTPRCICPDHGVLVQRIPWAFTDSDYTKAFDMRVAYAAAVMPINTVSKEYRIKWGTVGSCVRRVQGDSAAVILPLRKLKRIAIDETSYKKGYKYITVVQDLETSEIIWAHDGHGDEVLKLFFESLTEEQLDGIEYVVADGARWITRQVENYCKNAVRCVDPFHVVGWTTEALDEVRKRLSNDTKKNDLHS